MKVGARVTVFNYKMRARRQELGLSQVALAELVGVNTAVIGDLERLLIPYKDGALLEKLFFNVCDVLDTDMDTLFPADYIDAIEKNILPYQREQLLFLQDIVLNELPPSAANLLLPSPEEIVMKSDLEECLRDRVSELPEREQNIIYLRYTCDMTLEETGKQMNITRSRVKQIETTALRRLRAPSSIKVFSGEIEQNDD